MTHRPPPAGAMPARAAALIARLGLAPHPEGGWYREVFRGESHVLPHDGRGARPGLTTIYFLLPAGTASRWHRVSSDEAWLLVEGGPLELLELAADGTALRRHVLAPIGEGDDEPVRVIPAHAWQAARALGDYALVGCSVGPGFDFADFTMMLDDPEASAAVRARWPEHAPLI